MAWKRTLKDEQQYYQLYGIVSGTKYYSAKDCIAEADGVTSGFLNQTSSQSHNGKMKHRDPANPWRRSES
ncbi:unnamed protein product [Caretta caretta]